MSKDLTHLDDVCEDYRVAILRLRNNRDEWRDLARRLARLVVAQDAFMRGQALIGGRRGRRVMSDDELTAASIEVSEAWSALTDTDLARAAAPDDAYFVGSAEMRPITLDQPAGPKMEGECDA